MNWNRCDTVRTVITNLDRQNSAAIRNITISVLKAPPLRDAAHRYAPGQGSLRSPCQDFWRFCLTDSYFCFRQKTKRFWQASGFCEPVPQSVAMRSIAERRGTTNNTTRPPQNQYSVWGGIYKGGTKSSSTRRYLYLGGRVPAY